MPSLCFGYTKDRLGELTDELLEELWNGGQSAIERLYELREPIRYIRGASGDFTIPVTIEPVSSLLKLTTKALIDSGCTGSAINQAYVTKHGLDTRKALIPIPVYNADGTAIKAGTSPNSSNSPDHWRSSRTYRPRRNQPRQEGHLPRA